MMPLPQTDVQSLLIKGWRLQRQRARRPAQLCSPKLAKYFKKKGESLHCLWWLAQKTGHQSQRRRKRIKRLGKERGGGRLQGYVERKEGLEIGRAQKEIASLAKAWLLPSD